MHLCLALRVHLRHRQGSCSRLLHEMSKHHQMLQSVGCGACAIACFRYDIECVPALQACFDELIWYESY